MLNPDWDQEEDQSLDSGFDRDSDQDRGWSVSFAGCGFMGVYYIGGAACLLQRCPELLLRAPRVYGSSAGALTGAVLTTGVPLETVTAELMSLAMKARSHKLGPLHPDFNLMKHVRDFLLRVLPMDAHIRASGRLFVSVTRIPSRANQLLSEFSSREELIQALICSCFVPFYCGIIPPTFRGERFVDGAVSDNLPRCRHYRTITVSPYAGESDICPNGQRWLYRSQVRFNNLSLEVNPENLYRVTSTFFPPEPQVLAEICQNGYTDALNFLQKNGLDSESPLKGPQTPCCEWEHLFKSEDGNQSEERGIQLEKRKPKHHSWLNPSLTEKLPPEIRAVLCSSCRLSSTPSGLLSQLKSYLWLPRPRSPLTAAHRLVEWLLELPRDMNWFYSVFSPSWSGEEPEAEPMLSEIPLRRCKSLPSGLGLFDCNENSKFTFENHKNIEKISPALTPPTDLT